MKNIILSIHPQWAELIYSGEKTYELRRNLPKQMVTRVEASNQHKGYARSHYHYTSSPTVYLCETGTGGLITGYFTLGNIYGVDMCDMKPRTLRNVSKHSCVTQEDILEYYHGAYTMYVWTVHRAKKLIRPINISNYGLTRVPQGWCYAQKGGHHA